MGQEQKSEKNPCFLAETGFSCRFFPLNQSSEDGPKLSTAWWGAAAPWMLHDPESRRILDPSSKTWALFMGFPTKIAWWSNKKRVGLVYTCKWLSRLVDFLLDSEWLKMGFPRRCKDSGMAILCPSLGCALTQQSSESPCQVGVGPST